MNITRLVQPGSLGRLNRVHLALGFQTPLIANQTRSIVYQSGSRKRGLIRNPEDYLIAPSGKKFDESKISELVGNLKNYLQGQNVGDVSESLLLQVLTHKSFAHGKKPFNEKLSAFGSHLLKEVCSIYMVTNLKDGASTPLVEDLNFDGMGSDLGRSMIKKAVVAEYVRANIAGIEKDVFWKKRSEALTDPLQNGENLVLYDVMTATIGAVNLTYGQDKTIDFLQAAVLEGDNGLIKLAQEFGQLAQTNER